MGLRKIKNASTLDLNVQKGFLIFKAVKNQKVREFACSLLHEFNTLFLM
jgi:hypothetical protein